MFELQHIVTYGHQYTTVEFERYHYGPYAKEIVDCISEMEQDGILMCLPYTNAAHGNTCYSHHIKDEKYWEQYPLQFDKMLIADYLIDEYGSKSFDEIIQSVYASPPMARIKSEEDGIGACQYGRRIDMADNANVVKVSLNDLLLASKRRKSAPSFKVTEENKDEYVKFLINSYNSSDDLRRRVDCVANLSE